MSPGFNASVRVIDGLEETLFDLHCLGQRDVDKASNIKHETEISSMSSMNVGVSKSSIESSDHDQLNETIGEKFLLSCYI